MRSDEVEEIKRHFGVVAEGLERKIQVVAEAVSHLEGKMEREMGALRDEMTHGFDEVKAMIKFSYAELDRRVTSLETGFGLLEARLRKVEARLT